MAAFTSLHFTSLYRVAQKWRHIGGSHSLKAKLICIILARTKYYEMVLCKPQCTHTAGKVLPPEKLNCRKRRQPKTESLQRLLAILVVTNGKSLTVWQRLLNQIKKLASPHLATGHFQCSCLEQPPIWCQSYDVLCRVPSATQDSGLRGVLWITTAVPHCLTYCGDILFCNSVIIIAFMHS